MNYFYLLSGLTIMVITLLDLIKTTFSSNGGGRITNAVSSGVWKICFISAGRNGRSGLLNYTGPAVLIAILLVWIVGLWFGLFLMLLSDHGSIAKSTTQAVASPLEKLYYAGFTLSTLGMGDYVATTDAWRFVTTLASFIGLAFITASITYFVPVLSAVGLQSKLSLYISSMGKTPQQLLLNSWNGKDFSSFFDTTSDLCQMVMQHTLNHHSYPVIHYFHNKKLKLAITPAIALLAEAFYLLKYAVEDEKVKDELKMSLLQTTLDTYLETMQESFLKNEPNASGTPAPGTDSLREHGILLKTSGQIKQVFEQHIKKQRMLLSVLLQKDGWAWDDVYGTS